MDSEEKPFLYKDGKTEIQSNDEQPHHIKAMWFNLRMKWLFKFTALIGLIYFGKAPILKLLLYFGQ